MTDAATRASTPRVIVVADVESNALALINNVLTPAGIQAWPDQGEGPTADLLVVDMTQLRGDPLAGLRSRRERGDESPAIVLAAHFPANKMRELFQLGVRDVMFKPYRPAELCQAIYELADVRAREGSTQILSRRLELMRERLRRQQDELRLLGEIGRAVATLDDLDQILTRVAEAAAYVTDAEETHIYMADNQSGDLILRASKLAGEQRAALQRLRVQDSLVGQVIKTGEPLLHQPSLEGGAFKIQTGFLVQSLIQVPLRLGSRVVGVLGAYNRLASRRFDEHHLALLNALGDWASVALEHAFLIQQAKRVGPRLDPVIEATSQRTEAIEQASSILFEFLSGEQGPLGRGQLQRLQLVQKHLETLQAVPLAALPPEITSRFVDIPALIQATVQKFHAEARRNGLAIETGGLPLIPRFPGDAARTRRVIEALVGAAIGRSHEGRIVVRAHYFEVRGGDPDGDVRLPLGRAIADGQWAAVSVADPSPGLSPDTVRALTTPRPDPTAGLEAPGLSMGEARMIAESLGAQLWHELSASGNVINFAIPIA
jgi:DNA-binding NarL/FixJ family response regulator